LVEEKRGTFGAANLLVIMIFTQGLQACDGDSSALQMSGYPDHKKRNADTWVLWSSSKELLQVSSYALITSSNEESGFSMLLRVTAEQRLW
jgi:hypothetical protein